MSRRAVLLLGAGASFDAGLPLTMQLAERVVRNANSSAGSSAWVAALNFVYGAMMAHHSDKGGNPLAAVNIERLISALRLLQSRGDHEATPFVLSWKAPVDGAVPTAYEPSAFGGLGKEVQKHLLADHFWDIQKLESSIAQIALAAMRGTKQRVEAFSAAEDHILQELVAILSSVESVAYLAPLADLARSQESGLDIITLNYDLTIESLATQQTVSLTAGIEGWSRERVLRFPRMNAHINLIKVHGSLNWTYERTDSLALSGDVRLMSDSNVASDGGGPKRPWIVVGDRDKLGTDGPTLALMEAASRALNCADDLVVVGYGFADKHMNDLIRDWMLRSAKKRLIILDPGIDPTVPDPNPFRGALRSTYSARAANSFTSRVLCIPKGASSGLSEALNANFPRSQDACTYFRLDVERFANEGTWCGRISVTRSGPTVDSLKIHAQARRSGKVERWNQIELATDLNKIARQKDRSASYSQASLRSDSNDEPEILYFLDADYNLLDLDLSFTRSDMMQSAHLRYSFEWPSGKPTKLKENAERILMDW